MTEWEKQNVLKMSDEELAAEIPKWKPESDRGVFVRAEMERRRHVGITETIIKAAKPPQNLQVDAFLHSHRCRCRRNRSNRRDCSVAPLVSNSSKSAKCVD